MVAGLAAVLGAASTDEPFRLGSLTARRDPNSPLDRPVVLAATALALVVAALGAVALVGGAVLVRLALVARRHGERLGRPVTLGDLTVGEQVVMLPVPAVRGSTR